MLPKKLAEVEIVDKISEVCYNICYMIKLFGGPEFTIESSEAVIVLGHSEREQVGLAWATALDETGLFSGVEIVTTNRLDSRLGRTALRGLFEGGVAFTHSAGEMRVPNALQLVAHNPPEQTSWKDLLKRAADIGKDRIEKEADAHKTGKSDLAKAGLQLAGSPITSFRTIAQIHSGHSSVESLVNRRQNGEFLAGVAIVHSELDGFGFQLAADMVRASEEGITTLILPGHKHNEVLFAPRRTIDLMTPAIFPVE